ncbi:MAG TPA: hypothetical protein VJA94_20255 [Candidatus Angelobacter sp.]
MPQWATFDEETCSALRAKLPAETIVELPSASAMEHVLQRHDTAVAVLPVHGLGQAGLAVFRWNRVPAPVTAAEPVHPHDFSAPEPAPLAEVRRSSREIRATGFLGLSDESLYEDEEESQEKKSWWKRFWEE